MSNDMSGNFRLGLESLGRELHWIPSTGQQMYSFWTYPGASYAMTSSFLLLLDDNPPSGVR